jgi:hypothetical protein
MSYRTLSEKFVKAAKDYVCSGCIMANHDFDFNFEPTEKEQKLFEILKKEEYMILKGTLYYSQKVVADGDFYHFKCRKDVHDFFTERKLWEYLSGN